MFSFLFPGTPTHGYYVRTVDTDLASRQIILFVADQADNAYQCDVIHVSLVIASRRRKTQRRLDYTEPFEFVFTVSVIFIAFWVSQLNARYEISCLGDSFTPYLITY